MDCIFCMIIEGKIPSSKVYEDDKILAFRDVNPQMPVHVLFVPKVHIESANGINEENACLMASSLSQTGLIPIVSIYSTFLQRAYDILNHDQACRSGQTKVVIRLAVLSQVESVTQQNLGF